jgi:enoyl-CoA hydratase/carnithine racemase
VHPKVVIIKGNGEKAFCAGGDIVSIYKAKVDGIHPETP